MERKCYLFANLGFCLNYVQTPCWPRLQDNKVKLLLNRQKKSDELEIKKASFFQHSVWKSPKRSQLSFWILAFPPIFAIFKLTCLVWPQATDFQNETFSVIFKHCAFCTAFCLHPPVASLPSNKIREQQDKTLSCFVITQRKI